MKKGLLAIGLACLLSTPAFAAGGDYDDFNDFSADPYALDEEVRSVFGRFFQTQVSLGTGIPTGGLGEAYSAGLLVNLRFVYFFDRSFGTELGVGYQRNSGTYNDTTAAGQTIFFDRDSTIIPLTLGIRYGFNKDNLARGIGLMNPYLSAAAVLAFRNEAYARKTGESFAGLDSTLLGDYGVDSSLNTTAFGVEFGGGIGFDVYRDRLFIGLDFRYQLLFFSDESVIIGDNPGVSRSGDNITITATFTYNY